MKVSYYVYKTSSSKERIFNLDSCNQLNVLNQLEDEINNQGLVTQYTCSK